jgi:hypothetical protein
MSAIMITQSVRKPGRKQFLSRRRGCCDLGPHTLLAIISVITHSPE